mmetsp:Transcript_77889/g.147089  ORF Transcript_77889/g.147089 Transcript_77889/m.147089 type:complete len:251 (+) Transcript_77889:78-830(+)
MQRHFRCNALAASRRKLNSGANYNLHVTAWCNQRRLPLCMRSRQGIAFREFGAAASFCKAAGTEEASTSKTKAQGDGSEKQQPNGGEPTDGQSSSIPIWVFLLLGPGTLGLGAMLVSLTRRSKEEQFRQAAEAEFRAGCPELPDGMLSAFQTAPVRELETGHAYSSSTWTQEATQLHWKLEAHGRRSSPWGSWNLVLVRASKGVELAPVSGGAPAAQVRNWNPQAAQIEWHLVWEKASKDDALVRAHLIR